MSPDPPADDVAAALAADWDLLIGAHPDGWSRTGDGAFACWSGVPVPTLNGVWAFGADPRPEEIADLIDEVAATGVPHCLQTRPAAGEALTAVAHSRGMEPAGQIPLMVSADPPRTGHDARGLHLREVGPAEVGLHTSLLAAGFGAPEEHFARLMAPPLLGLEGLRCYVGELASEPVTTGLGLRVGSHVGIFNVATISAVRGRGFGGALTAKALADGRRDGARWAWLQSSPVGLGVYEGLGFRTVERWNLWIGGVT